MDAFLDHHATAFILVGGYVFSAVMSTMPPLPDNASYFVRWGHDTLQVLAANWNKVQRPSAQAK